jgi:hypothetical protein
MSWRARGSSLSSFVGLCVAWSALASGCDSSAAGGSTDAGDSSADATADASANCGILMMVTRVADCTYALPGEPPDPANAGVYLVVDGGITKIPRDRQDQEGWDYVDMTYNSIRLYGTWCAKDQAGALAAIDFIVGCPPPFLP